MAGPVGTLVESGLHGLLAVRNDLSTGGVFLPPLQYDQAKELLALVNQISGNPLIMVLDKWEHTPSPTLREEHSLLHAFLNHRHDWPTCHVVLAVRPNTPAEQLARQLHREFGDRAAIVQLQGMDLLERDEGARVIQHLHSAIPATTAVNDSHLLSLIDGYAGVLYRRRNALTPISEIQTLEQLAEDAHANRYEEIEPIVKQLLIMYQCVEKNSTAVRT